MISLTMWRKIMNDLMSILRVAKVRHQWLGRCETKYKSSKNNTRARHEDIHGVANLAHRRLEVTIQQCQQTYTCIKQTQSVTRNFDKHMYQADRDSNYKFCRSGTNVVSCYTQQRRLSTWCSPQFDGLNKHTCKTGTFQEHASNCRWMPFLTLEWFIYMSIQVSLPSTSPVL